MHAVVISVGDELVLGQTVDTNSAYLSSELSRRGVMTLFHHTVADDQSAIARAIAEATRAAELVIVTGGLGPTDDDLTRQALAQAMGVELVLDEQRLAEIEALFARRSRTMSQRNRVQAMHPRGSSTIENTCGTAPGIKAVMGGATVYVTPGVPSELYAMFERSIGPEIDRFAGGVTAILTATIHTFGQGESAVADLLGPLMARDRNPLVGTTVSHGVVSVRVRSTFDPARAQRELEQTIREVESALGPIVYGRDDTTLQRAVVTLLKQRNLTVSTAESCTGGLVGQMLTDVSGSSAVYVGGWVTYSDAMKRDQLGVPPEVLERHGAVSGEVAGAMAEAARKRSGANIAVSITGIAGPDGGTLDKPVGTVYAGLSGEVTGLRAAWLLNLAGDRATIRDRAAKTALQLLRLTLLGVDPQRMSWVRRVI